MSIEEAKLILQAYHHGGEDALDPFFAEALELARTDRALGVWFAEQLDFDKTMQRAIKSEIPPADLKERILTAYSIPFSSQKPKTLFRPFRLLAMAAAVVCVCVGVLFFRHDTTAPSMTVASFTHEALAIKEENRIVLGTKNNDPSQLRTWLAERGAPHDFLIPRGLQGLPSVGCQSYFVHGKKVALICFDLGHNQVAHLFVIDQSALSDASSGTQPQLRSDNGLAFATWTAGGKSFVLTGDNITEETIRKLI